MANSAPRSPHLKARFASLGGTDGLGADAVVPATVTVPHIDGNTSYLVVERDLIDRDLHAGWVVSHTYPERPEVSFQRFRLSEVLPESERSRALVAYPNRPLRDLAADRYSSFDLADIPGGLEPSGLRTELAGEYLVFDPQSQQTFGAYTTYEGAATAASRFSTFLGTPCEVDEKKVAEFDRIAEVLPLDPAAFRAARDMEPRFGTRTPFVERYLRVRFPDREVSSADVGGPEL